MSFDVLIIGSGVAGMTAAIELAEAGHKVGLISAAEKLVLSNSHWAQGGIIYPPEQNLESTKLIEDIQKASGDTSSDQAAKDLAVNSREVFDRLLLQKCEVPFEKSDNGEGELAFTQEACHQEARIAYTGDYTGESITNSLYQYLHKIQTSTQLKVFTSHTAIDLITNDHHGLELKQRFEDQRVLGAYVLEQSTQQVKKMMAKAVVLATGGVGSLYLHHSNTELARGDGHAMAKRAGAKVINMEFIQFHPTTFYTGSSQRRFLISEALRGEGGVLLNAEGERFMSKYHPDCELAPRDVVSRAILAEMIESRQDYVYLDMTHKESSWIQSRFPRIHSYCLAHGYDLSKTPIPVVPAAHYTCGGVKVDLKGRTTLKGLYAIGEVACNGLHGANRLASTSLLEGLYYADVVARELNNCLDQISLYDEAKIKDWVLGTEQVDNSLVAQDWISLKQTMWNYLGLKRSKNRMGRASAMLRELSVEIHKFYKNAKLSDQLIGLRNGIEVASMVLDASIRNHKSEGCFFREEE